MTPRDISDIYTKWIRWIGDGTGVPDMFLHVHAGMIIFVLTRLITGRSLGSPVPLTAVLVCELANEVMDRLHYGAWRWFDTGMDIINTLFWPAVIFLTVRSRPLARQ